MSRAARRHPERHNPVLDPRRAPVVVGYVRPDDVDGRWADCLMSLIEYEMAKPEGLYRCRIIGETGPRIARARNDVVEQFLTHPDCAGAEWLLWLDTDMIFDPNFLEQVYSVADAVERPIVGGLCFAGGRSHVTPTLYTFSFTGSEEGGDLNIESDLPLFYPANTLVDVGGTGSACVLIHRSVFEEIQARYVEKPNVGPMIWYQDLVINGKDWGEDLVFCLRAMLCGKRTYVHTGIKVGHRKRHILTEDSFIAYTAKLEHDHPELEGQKLTAEQLNQVLSLEPVA